MINASCKSPGAAHRHVPPSVHCLQSKVAFVGKVKPRWSQPKSVFLTSGRTRSRLSPPTATTEESSERRNFTMCKERNRYVETDIKRESLHRCERQKSQHLWVFYWVTHQHYITPFILFGYVFLFRIRTTMKHIPGILQTSSFNFKKSF